MEDEGLAYGRNHARLVDDESGDGVGLVIGQRPVEGTVEVADGY